MAQDKKQEVEGQPPAEALTSEQLVNWGKLRGLPRPPEESDESYRKRLAESLAIPPPPTFCDIPRLIVAGLNEKLPATAPRAVVDTGNPNRITLTQEHSGVHPAPVVEIIVRNTNAADAPPHMDEPETKPCGCIVGYEHCPECDGHYDNG